ncbi:MAG: methanesulfonate monooxygenase small subunit [Gammaproteobacteria bacterium]|jgi:methanesulfonate monooxygenase small subunit
MSTDQTSTVEKVKNTIYEACIALDDQQWMDWINLCDEDFHYAIKAFSPEINADMTYLGGDRGYMEGLVNMLPKHNSDNSPLNRHCVVYRVKVAEDGKSATARSSVAVYQTTLDGANSHVDAGESKVFIIGSYHDEFSLDGDNVKFTKRDVRLDTRRLDKGTHWPI